jgi:predicted 2-oxoglutarate/Fe(II)-dependent dioxygenase YbiX
MPAAPYDLLPDSPLYCRVVPGLFSPAECRELLAPAQPQFGSSAGLYPTYYRNNDRYVVDDAALAAQLLARAAPYLPAQLPATDAAGPWALLGVNPRLRFCRYQPGQYFHRHLDGVHHAAPAVESRLTFMVYLNDAADFVGGRTLFFRDQTSPEVWAAYEPRLGDLIVFDHQLWHEGEELQAGEKYVLRSDLLYARAGAATAAADGHRGYIWQLCPLTPQELLSAGRDQTIRVWDAAGHCRQQLRAHSHSILALGRLDADRFLSGSRDQRVVLWQRGADGNFAVRYALTAHQGAVLALARLDADTFASAGADHLVHVYASATGQRQHTLRGHQDWVWQVLPLAPEVLATSSEDGSIRLWHWPSEQLLDTLPGAESLPSLAYRPESRELISGSLSGQISVHPLTAAGAPAGPARRFQAHQGLVRALLPLPGGLLASGGEDNCVRIWHLATGACRAEYRHDNFVQALARAPDGQLLSASYDGTIRRWPLPAG